MSNEDKVYVITGIGGDPYGDYERQVLAVVDTKEQAELAKDFYSSSYDEVEFECFEIKHFDKKEFYYSIGFTMELQCIEGKLYFKDINYARATKIFKPFKKDSHYSYTSSIDSNTGIETCRIGGHFNSFDNLPDTPKDKAKFLIDMINCEFTDFTKMYGNIKFFHFTDEDFKY